MLLISDASVLIDMEVGGLSPAMFRSGHEFAVPDILFEEELREQHAGLVTHGLKVEPLSAEIIQASFGLRERHPGPGHIDLLALALAQHKGCGLLTGDRRLVAAARAEGVEAHGTLWIVQALMSAGLTDAPAVKRAYLAMHAHESRLPWDDVAAQLAALGEVWAV
jgi:hypothetical protein